MYKSELMDKILTSESGKRMIQRVTHKYGASFVGLWFFQVMGMENDTLKAMIDDFKLQIFPQTATWSLPIWEDAVGIATDITLPIEERRRNIIEKMRKRAPMNPARIEQIISGIANCDVWMDEYAGKNRFSMHIYGIPSFEQMDRIRKKLKEIKQAHKVFDTIYQLETKEETKIYRGNVVAQYKSYTTIPFDRNCQNDDVSYSMRYKASATRISSEGNVISAQKYNTYDDIKDITYNELSRKTYAQILYKED